MQKQRANYYNIRGEQIDPRNKAALADGMYIARYGGKNSRVYLVGGEWQNLPVAQDGIDFEGLDFSVDSDGDGVPDNAVMQNGVAYWPGGSAVLNQNNEYEIVNTSDDEGGDGDGGGGNKDASTGLTFDEAFRQARDAGLKTFTWNGKEYTTRTESESEEEFEKKFQSNENDETTDDETTDDTTDDEKKDDEQNIVDDSITEDENIQLNQANQKFIKDWAPESGDPLSAIGDTGILDLVKAIDTTVKDFKSENYYDPGSKEDYQKYSIKNTTNQDMYINPEALAKGKRAGDVLMDEEQKTEYYMQKYLDDRAERNPDKYGVVEDYDDDLYRRTGYLNFKDGPKQGDLIEQSGVMGDDATHIGWSLDKMNKYNTAENYLTPSDTEGMSDVNAFPTPYVLPNTGPDATQTDETVNTLSDGQVDANNNGMPDYLEVEPERYGGPVYYMGGPFYGYMPLPKAQWGKLLDYGQGALSVAGMIPGVGILADAANTAISGGRAAYAGYTGDEEAQKKHLTNMGINAVAMIPGVGQVATAAKGVKGATNVAKAVGTDAVATSAKYLKSPSKIANKYVNAVTDIGKVGDSVADTVQATGQTASLYKKGDFVADEVQGEGKFNKTRQYGTFADSAEPDETPIDGGTLPEVEVTPDSGTTPKLDPDNIDMSTMAIGSDERRAAYDAKGWAYDDTISASPSGGSDQMASAPLDSSEEMSTTSSVDEEYTPQSVEQEEPVEEIEEDVAQYGGSFYGYIPPLPQAQFGYMGSSRGKSNLNQSLKVAGTTALGSMLLRTVPQVISRYNRKNDAWEMYNDNMDQMWARPGSGYDSWVDYCENNTCPNIPNFTPSKSDWFSGQGYTGQGSGMDPDYYMGLVGGNTKEEYRQNIGAGIKQGLKDGLKTGLVNYGLNALLDNTRFGRKLQRNFDINLGWYNRQDGGESLPKAQGGTGTGITFTPGGYNSLTNQIDPLSFEDGTSEVYDGLNVQGQGTPQDNPSQLDMNASIYASKQAMNRSMDEFKAFTADMNKRIENPSLSMFQVDTNPLNVPQADFSMPDDLQRSMDEIDYKVASADNRVTSDGNIIPTADEMNQSIEETNANMQAIVDNAPKYEGTQENLDRYNEATELGFEDDFSDPDDPKFKMAEYADYEKEQEEEEIKRDLTRDKLNKDNKENNPSFLDKAWNAKNRLLDSKAGQTFGKIGAGAVRIAKPLNRLLEMREEAKRKKQMQAAYLADNMFATTDMVSGSKGDYDINSGIFRADDKVVSRQGKYGTEISRFLYQPNVQMKKGGSFFNEGDTAEIDVNMYKELIAAGADLEII